MKSLKVFFESFRLGMENFSMHTYTCVKQLKADLMDKQISKEGSNVIDTLGTTVDNVIIKVEQMA
jgi:hypothetical protein